MVLVVEKTRTIDGKKWKNKLGFKDMTAALKYAMKWVDQKEHTDGLGVETWTKEVKFGFFSIDEHGTESEIIVENLDELVESV